jgi:SAM-dependent methyltransferase
VSRLGVVKELLHGDARARGRVLDAGTGGGFMTEILAEFRPAELHSVSVDESAFSTARSRLPSDLGDRVRFVQGDPGDPGFLSGEEYDLIVGDYLLAAAAGHRPFREIDLLRGLVGRLAPGGLLVLTGLEPLAVCRTAEEEVVRTVLRWWAGLTYLGGEEMYREIPARWVVDRLRELAVQSNSAPMLEVEEPRFSPPLLWSISQLRGLAEDAVRRAESGGETGLASFSRSYLRDVCRRAAGLPGFATGGRRVPWSRDWVARATRADAPSA